MTKEQREGDEAPADALRRIEQRLQEATVKFGLGEMSSSTYQILRKRLESERAQAEARLIEESEPGR